ncbi:MAG: DUF1446 domain-containing protein [Tissierellales bacterium]|jgi:predicted enzyme related to lactoylglutathione lyase|nr:DUF1446 domain-containing protein [Tissierellales bacterium]
MKKVRIGSGAGYGGDRLEPALELLEKGNLDYIGFECLAERTIAIAQQQKLQNPEKGYNGLLEYRMDKVLPLAYENKVKVITNMGAANPKSALKVVKDMAKEKGLKGLKIAAVFGDNVYDNIDRYSGVEVWETGDSLSNLDGEIISANAYLGIKGIVDALEKGADVIITGRVSDPALFLAPLVYEFGWTLDDYDKLGKGTLVGHLLECAGQITGGYYADPGFKDVENLWELGFPIAEVTEDGNAVITKVEEAGGLVIPSTCKEQMLYEIHDPSKYITPDCIADFSNVKMKTVGKDRVQISGATGYPKTDTYKVSLGYKDCFIGEGEISYGGSGCLERAELGKEIVLKRLEMQGIELDEIRTDIIGVNSIFKNDKREVEKYPEEVRLRIAGRTKNKTYATRVGNELETLYTNGPSAGGGVSKGVKEIISVASILIPKKDVDIKIQLEEVE